MIKKGVIFVIAFLFLLNFVSAISEGECVTAEVSDISPSSIGVGEEFTVGVQIENCGDVLPEFVSFELLNPPVDIVIKEPLILNISKLYYGNSERFITYHMRTTDDAQQGTHVINTRLSYGKINSQKIKNYNITFNVIGEGADLSIASFKTSPVLPRKGDIVELTMRIENTGDGTAKAVSVYADHPFQGLKQSFIGALDSDEDGPAILTFIANERGVFEFPVTISYKDDFGANELVTNVSFNVLNKKSNIWAILFSLILIALLGWGIYYFMKKNKSKDKIIHQLLSGETEGGIRNTRIVEENFKEKRERMQKEKRRKEFKRDLLKKYKK